MGKHNLTLPLLLILVIFVMSSPGIIFAQQPETENAEPTEIPVPDYCGENTIPSIENPKVCVAICGDGTSLTDGKCLPSKGFFDLTDNAWIGWGVLTAAVIAGFGILITFSQQKRESQKRTHEIIQTYSSKLTEITNKEITLKTKQDCALYAEQYLDTLEEISTLALAGNFDRGTINRSYKHITDYFNNNFAYGYDLWWWYHKYVHGFGLVEKDDTDYIQNRLWQVSNKTETPGYKLEDILYKKIVPNPDLMHPKIIWKYDEEDSKEIPKEELATIRDTLNYSSKLSNIGFTQDEIKSYIKDGTIKAKRRALLNFLRDDRWPDFRSLCRDNNITEFKFDYKGLGGYDASKENWRVLPNLMYYDYEEIPDEDGLSKAEFVDIIRPYANDLAKFVDQEKSMTKPEQFEVYAEQYLETLEQIATLYRHKIIPTKASEYFENKFSYGCNLWSWYHYVVLKFSEKLHKALWDTSTLIRLKDIKTKTKKQLSEMSEEEKEQLKEVEYDEKTYNQFLTSYSNSDKRVAAEQLIIEDPDVWKLIKLAAKSKINQTELQLTRMQSEYETRIILPFTEDKTESNSENITKPENKLKPTLKNIEKYKNKIKKAKDLFNKASTHASVGKKLVEDKKNEVYTAAQELSQSRIDAEGKDPTSLEAKNVDKATEKLKEAKDILTKIITTQKPSDGLDEKKKVIIEANIFTNDDVNDLLKEFVIGYLDNERWEDFRWWCKENPKKEITPFQDDPSEGLILPKKMWEAYYD